MIFLYNTHYKYYDNNSNVYYFVEGYPLYRLDCKKQ